MKTKMFAKKTELQRMKIDKVIEVFSIIEMFSTSSVHSKNLAASFCTKLLKIVDLAKNVRYGCVPNDIYKMKWILLLTQMRKYSVTMMTMLMK